MAALTNSRNTPEMADGGRIRVYPVEANTNIYLGAMVALNAAGNAAPASATTTTANAQKVIGRAERMHHGTPGQNAINNPGAAGAISIVARKGVFMFANDGTIGAAQVGLACFAVDDNTVGAADRASGASVQQYAAAGQVVAIDSSGQVWVDFWHQATSAA
ncbi:MAG: hypothetical protein Q7S58_14020 [Candidatus Binatus sp.]|uniref:hypothetical protein n=1 Tax=Candidatus Binatus sp. TaxID=2811406 RepID=UPI00271D0761|nr:hypothetical protein [Candidatus Binatus sp.]MDO8433517.1 hypothetical protein [Candidatus Binatus sp.]